MRKEAGLARAAVLAAPAAAILCYAPFLSDPYSLPKLTAVCACVCAAWTALALKGSCAPRTRLDKPLLAVWTVLLLSACFSIDKPLSLIGQSRAYAHGLLTLFTCTALYYAAAASRLEEDGLRLASILTLCAAASSAFAVYRAPWGTRVIGLSGSPVYLGSCLLAAAPFSLALALSGGRKARFLGAAGFAAILCALALTYSRGAYLGAFAGCAFFLYFAGVFPRISIARGKTAAYAGAGAVLLALAIVAAQSLRSSGLADSARLETWRIGLISAARRPILGGGPDTFMTVFRADRDAAAVRVIGTRHGQDDAHNDLIEAAATTGAAGLAAYLWLLWSLCMGARKSLCGPVRLWRAAAAGSLLGLFVQAKFNPLPFPSLVLASLCAALLCREDDLKERNLDRRPADSTSGRPRGGTGRSWGPRGRPAYAAAGLAAAAFLFAARLAAADRAFLKADIRARKAPAAAVPYFEQALRLNPWDMAYLGGYHRFLLSWAPKSETSRQAAAMLARASALSREAAAAHPNDPGANHMRGLSLYAEAMAGEREKLEEAEIWLERAQRLDPYFMPTRILRRLVAEKLPDPEKAARIAEEIRAVRASTPRR